MGRGGSLDGVCHADRGVLAWVMVHGSAHDGPVLVGVLQIMRTPRPEPSLIAAVGTVCHGWSRADWMVLPLCPIAASLAPL
jgi:hypothetical protein